MSNIKIRINTRYFRIYIFRQCLRKIGEPEFINFGYDPETMQLMVMGSFIDDRKSLRVRHNKNGSFFICSKPLIEGIRKVSHILAEPASYLVEGTVSANERVIIFPLKEAVITSEETERDMTDEPEAEKINTDTSWKG